MTRLPQISATSDVDNLDSIPEVEQGVLICSICGALPHLPPMIVAYTIRVAWFFRRTLFTNKNEIT